MLSRLTNLFLRQDAMDKNRHLSEIGRSARYAQDLCIDQRHHVFWITLTGGCSEGEDLINSPQVVGAELEV
jgi:hypothetical protein